MLLNWPPSIVIVFVFVFFYYKKHYNEHACTYILTNNFLLVINSGNGFCVKDKHFTFRYIVPVSLRKFIPIFSLTVHFMKVFNSLLPCQHWIILINDVNLTVLILNWYVFSFNVAS